MIHESADIFSKITAAMLKLERMDPHTKCFNKIKRRMSELLKCYTKIYWEQNITKQTALTSYCSFVTSRTSTFEGTTFVS